MRLDSTNITAHKMAELGADEGTVVIAYSQSKGKGRMKRSWQSPPGNLYNSVILKPQISPTSSAQITLIAAVATAEAIGKTTGIKVQVKWPNDVLIHDKKVAGILTEMECQGNTVNFIILGIGVNINAPLNLFPRELHGSITSLREEAGDYVSFTDFSRCLYQEIEGYYDLWMTEGFSRIRNEYNKFFLLPEESVQISSGEKTMSGKIQGIDDKGALLLHLSNGNIERIIAGDVTTRPKAEDLRQCS